MKKGMILFFCVWGLPSSAFAADIGKDQVKKALPSSWVSVAIEECQFSDLGGEGGTSEKFWCVQGNEPPTTLPQGTEIFRIYPQKLEKGTLFPLYELKYTGGGMRRYVDPSSLSQILITGCSTGLCLDAVTYHSKAFKTVLHWKGQTGQNDPRLRVVANSKVPSPIIIQSNSAVECTDTEIYTWSVKKSAYEKTKETCWEKRGPGEEKALSLNQ